MSIRRLFLAATLLLLASCAATGPAFQSGQACETASLSVIDGFAGARRGRCTVLADDHVRVTNLPEDGGYINDSPWYAMKVVPKTRTAANITINYRGGQHRYQPKISTDGIHWSALDDSAVSVGSDGKSVTITTPASDTPFWIAAQEILTPAIYDAWMKTMVATGNTNLSVLGESRNRQPIALLSSNSDARDVLFLVGRQHPPEVTGAIAFLAFYETLMADSELANTFRKRFSILAIPMINPDGVIGGNWRHNLGGTDLNRDWGPFEQPETQLIRDLLDRVDAGDKHIRVFLDFHSTQKNVFYTQNADHPSTPPNFTRTWLDNAKPRIENYEYVNKAGGVERIGVSKNYMYKRYGIPSLTYEVGDETERPAIRASATVFAEEMMKLMLLQSFE